MLLQKIIEKSINYFSQASQGCLVRSLSEKWNDWRVNIKDWADMKDLKEDHKYEGRQEVSSDT